MDTYYQTLGLAPGASQIEIKKAYFRLVRQYSPEKNPEQFRQIREAYELLKNVQEETGPSFPPPRQPLAAQFLKQIREYEQRGNPPLFRDACQEAFRLFPDEIQFQYLLAIAQRRAGNSGKAIQTGEALVKKDPANKWYWRELALAFIERGYVKKAIPAIKNAFEAGCEDSDFLLTASIVCYGQNEIDITIRLLLALVRKEKRWGRNDIPDVLEAYMRLCICAFESHFEIDELFRLMKGFLNQHSIYLEEYMDMVQQLLIPLSLLSQKNNACQKEMDEILQILQAATHSDKSRTMLSIFVEAQMLDRLDNDERIGETVKWGVHSFYEEEPDPELRSYSSLDVRLCMLKERETIIPQLEILEEEYPLLYENLRDFAEKLRSGANLNNYRDSLQRQYASLSQYIDGGQYFEQYPDEKARSFGRVVYQSDTFQPYVRQEKKVGRNDPCPCGSGKKYKHCCMNK